MSGRWVRGKEPNGDEVMECCMLDVPSVASVDDRGKGQGITREWLPLPLHDAEKNLQGQSEPASRHRKNKRRRRVHNSMLIFTILLYSFLFLSPSFAQETPLPTTTDTVSSSSSQPLASSSSDTAVPSSTASAPLAIATLNPVQLTESISVRAQLDVTSSSPARFFLSSPFQNTSNSLQISATLCSGPSIPAYNSSNTTLLQSLGKSTIDVRRSTLVRMYVSTSQDNQQPGPDSLPKRDDNNDDVQYLAGGFAPLNLENTERYDGAWISIYPPEDVRNTTGTWILTVAASTAGAPALLMGNAGLSFSDTDNNRALVTSFNYTAGNSPNISLYVLPTMGAFSLANADYFNSSTCAITEAFQSFNATTNDDAPRINGSETDRGSTKVFAGDERRLQWEISGLQSKTNYTAWIVEYRDIGSLTGGGTNIAPTQATTLWPAIKFITKDNENCRLVYNVPFCPQVAYSIPVGPDVTTERALDVINRTVTPNYVNFTTTVDTFPCGSQTFGNYSPVRTCDDCKRAYQDWLCAVTMPRCTNSIPRGHTSGSSAAIIDPSVLTGQPTELNSDLLPYTVNRKNDSRQSYIDEELQAGSYGELLPCIYTCFFVSRSCPTPLVQWACPSWDISAQVDYGAFADSGSQGLGAGENGGAGLDGQRWGGPTRYIAQDAFGRQFCNAMGVDRLLREDNGVTRGILVDQRLVVGLALLVSTLLLVP